MQFHGLKYGRRGKSHAATTQSLTAAFNKQQPTFIKANTKAKNTKKPYQRTTTIKKQTNSNK